MNEKKYRAIKALDEALDEEMITYAEKFVEMPTLKTLGVLCKIVTVDMYTDAFLGEHDGDETAGVAVR